MLRTLSTRAVTAASASRVVARSGAATSVPAAARRSLSVLSQPPPPSRRCGVRLGAAAACPLGRPLAGGQPRRGFASFPDHIVLTMPALSPTMEKGNIASWKVSVGDKVRPGDVMAEVETDKATVAFESVEEGVIAKILMPAGSADVVVGTPVAVLAESADDVKAFESFSVGGDAAQSPQKPAAAASEAPAAAQAAPAAGAAAGASAASAGGRVIASPAARRVASEQGVSLQGIQGTGPNARILQADVKEQAGVAKAAPAAAPTAAAPAAAAPRAAAAPAAPAGGDFTDVPHTSMRRVIASRLSLSKQTIPHYYLSVDVQMDAVNALRTDLNASLQQSAPGSKLSVNDFLIKAAALACRKVPAANSSWQDNSIRQFNYVDVSVAVSTDAGLVTPIVKDADAKGLAAIAGDVKALAAKARANKLQPHEFQGGTFTLSNLGMFGVKNFSAIINPPQSAILAVGATEARVVGSAEGGYATAHFCSVTLSCDHRVVDGAVGAQWLQAFKGFMEKPSTMLL